MQKLSDQELLLHLQNHQEKALATLHQRYYAQLYDLAYIIIQNSLLADEVVADVFVKLWLKRTQIKIQSSLKLYLLATTRNLAINAIKKERTHFADIEEVPDQETPLSLPADRNLEWNDFQKQINQIIAELPPQRQLVFRLNRLDGLKYKEIADVLSISVYTVQKHMNEALKYVARNNSRFTKSLIDLLILLLLMVLP